jgi:hypothetical protein
MDFIEQLFGFSPDGGNGTLELSLILGAFFVVVGVVSVVRFLRHRAHGMSV